MCNDCLGKLKRSSKVYVSKEEFYIHNAFIDNNIELKFDAVLFPMLYEGYARELVHRLKYNDKRAAAYTMAAFIFEIIKRYSIEINIITFVPSSKKRLRERGYNQSELIAIELSNLLELPINNLLQRVINTKSQVLFNGRMRWYNVRDAFLCLKPLVGENVLIIDDVITTGATMHYCSQALKASGAGVVYAAAFAGGNFVSS